MELAGESIEATGDGRVDSAIPHQEAKAADEIGVDPLRDFELFTVEALESLNQIPIFGSVERSCGFQGQGLRAASGSLQRKIFLDDRAEQSLATFAHQK